MSVWVPNQCEILYHIVARYPHLIEWDILRHYQMEKPWKDGWEYILTIPYETDEDLDRIIYDDILGEAHRIADMRNGFIEADVISLDDPNRSW